MTVQKCCLTPEGQAHWDDTNRMREGRGNPIQASKMCNLRQDLLSRGCCKLWTLALGFLSPFLNVVIDYFSHSCLKMCQICLKLTLDATFLHCVALTFCDVIGELLAEWIYLTLQGGTTFLLTSKLADIPVSRVRIIESNTTLREGRGNLTRVSKICNPRRGLSSRGCWMLQILDTKMGFPSRSLNVVIDYFLILV